MRVGTDEVFGVRRDFDEVESPQVLRLRKGEYAVGLRWHGGRSKSNLSRTLKTMSQYGLVELRPGARGTLVPRVPYDQVRLEVSLTGTRSGSVGVSP